MNAELKTFVTQAKAENWTTEEIRERLLDAGWSAAEVDEALGGKTGLAVPHPHADSSVQGAEKVSSRALEYKIFAALLVLTIAGVILTANFMISMTEWAPAAFPVAMLVVCAPPTLYLFLRLRHAEALRPELKRDPSRRRALQAVQLIAFLAFIIHTIVLLYMIISGYYWQPYDQYSQHASIWDGLGRWLVTTLIAGGIFLYYWRDERRHA